MSRWISGGNDKDPLSNLLRSLCDRLDRTDLAAAESADEYPKPIGKIAAVALEEMCLARSLIFDQVLEILIAQAGKDIHWFYALVVATKEERTKPLSFRIIHRTVFSESVRRFDLVAGVLVAEEELEVDEMNSELTFSLVHHDLCSGRITLIFWSSSEG